MKKSTKSQQGGLTPSSFRTTGGVHELVAISSAWRVCAARDKSKIGGFAALHGFSYTTRANIAHEIAEQIRARIVCTPAESAWRAWVEFVRRRKQGFSPAFSSGRRGTAIAVDEVLHVYCAKQILSRYVRTQTFAKISTREVRHSLTWHSSESESALKRFEPVAVVKL